MENVVTSWSREAQIKRKDLKQGMIYILKNGEVRLYVGENAATNKLCFYLIGTTFVLDDWRSSYYMLHGELQAKHLLEYCKAVLVQGFRHEAFVEYATLPELRCAWYAAYTPEKLHDICNRYMMLSSDFSFLQQIKFAGAPSEKIKSEWVSSKELVPGDVYFSGHSPWRATYVYIGRLANKSYVWCFIGNSSAWDTNPCQYLTNWGSDALTVTTKNKAVRQLTAARVESWNSDARLLVGKHYDVEPVKRFLETQLKNKYGWEDGRFV